MKTDWIKHFFFVFYILLLFTSIVIVKIKYLFSQHYFRVLFHFSSMT